MMTEHSGKRLTLIVRIVTGSLFFFSGLLKVEDPAAFTDAVRSFDLLPDSVVPFFAVCIIVTEIVCGMMVLLGSRLRETTAVLFILMLIFTAVLISALLSGGAPKCGCFGERYSLSADEWSIIRNILLLMLIAWLNRTSGDRTSQSSD